MTVEQGRHLVMALEQLRAFIHMNQRTRPAGYYAVTCAIDHLACALAEALVPGGEQW
jgi:hypothetical protein